MFVTIDMNEGKIAPNSFNFAGGVTGSGSGSHASTSTETAALLRGENTSNEDWRLQLFLRLWPFSAGHLTFHMHLYSRHKYY